MKLWRFKDYITSSGENLISDWYNAQPGDIQAEMDVELRRLAAVQNWNKEGGFEILRKKHKGLCEIKFLKHIGKKRQFRIAGFFHFNDPVFIMVTACEKGGRNASAHPTFDLALAYLKQFEAGMGDIHESFIY